MNEEEEYKQQDESTQRSAKEPKGKRKIPIHEEKDDSPNQGREEPPQQNESDGEQDEEAEVQEEADEASEAEEADAGAEETEKDTVTISFAEYEELKTLAEERDEYLQRLQRSVADYQNLQKRLKKERKRAYENGVRETLEHILPLADTLNRARQAAEQSEKPEDVEEGLKLIEKEFYDSLERFNVEPVESVNEPFDPDYHHAVLQQPTSDVPPQTVVDEIKKGFVRGDTVIRPAQVSVSVEPQEPDEDEKDDE